MGTRNLMSPTPGPGLTPLQRKPDFSFGSSRTKQIVFAAILKKTTDRVSLTHALIINGPGLAIDNLNVRCQKYSLGIKKMS